MNYPKSLDEIKGQEHAKRAIEVAAVGNHSIRFVPNPTSKDTELVDVIERLASERFGVNKQLVYPSDITIELGKDTRNDILASSNPYPIAEIAANVSKAPEYLPRVEYNPSDRNTELLRMGIDKLGMTQLDVLRVISVSKSIAALSKSAIVKPEHLSEAMQYCHRVLEDRP